MRLLAFLAILIPTISFAADHNPYLEQMLDKKRQAAEKQRMETLQKIQYRQQNPYAYMKRYDTEAATVKSVSFDAQNDGHFYVPAQIQGSTINFLADTGASAVFLTQEDARKAGLSVGSLNYNIPFQTANGTAYAASTSVKTLHIGPIQLENVQVAVAKSPGGISLLGMDFFRQLSKYDVQNNKLTLYK